MCKSLNDPEPCCCPDWVIEELLDDARITDNDINKDPKLKSMLGSKCVDCYLLDELIEDKAVAEPHKNKKSPSFPKKTFDAIMRLSGFGSKDMVD